MGARGAPAAKPGEPEAPKARRERKRRFPKWPTKKPRWFTALMVLGLILVSMGAGRLLFPREINEVVVENEAAALSGESGPMPDILGLERIAAEYVLEGSSITAPVRFEERPSAGTPGAVVAQTPAAGAATEGEDIEVVVTVAAEMTMPDYAGRPMTEVRQELDDAGAVVVVTRVLDMGEPEGNVTGTVPEEGEIVGEVVELLVADEGSTVMLSDVTTESRGDWSGNSNVSVDGTEYADVWTGTPREDSDDPFGGYWTLGRHAGTLTMTVGTTDAGEMGSGRIVIKGDGEVIEEIEVRHGESREIEVSVDDVLRLEIEAFTNDEDVQFALADATLRVTPDGARELTS